MGQNGDPVNRDPDYCAAADAFRAAYGAIVDAAIALGLGRITWQQYGAAVAVYRGEEAAYFAALEAAQERCWKTAKETAKETA